MPLKTNPTPGPRVAAIAPTQDLGVRVTWGAGPRAGRTEELDLSPILKSMKFFRPVRNDPALFATVHPFDYGTAVAWGDDEEIDLSAGAILRLAEETMRAGDLRTFIAAQGLTETSLAAILDYSRRQIVGFINEGRPIPRVVSLACRYIGLVGGAKTQVPASQPARFSSQGDFGPSVAIVGEGGEGGVILRGLSMVGDLSIVSTSPSTASLVHCSPFRPSDAPRNLQLTGNSAMLLEPFAITTFCDDIRYEIGGKYSLIGVYRDSLIFQGGTFPITLARLGLSITFVEHPSAPFADIDIHVLLPGDTREKPSYSFTVHPEGAAPVPDAPEGTRRVVNFHLILGPLTIKEGGLIKVRLAKNGQRYRAGVLQVQTAQVQGGAQPQAAAPSGGQLPASQA